MQAWEERELEKIDARNEGRKRRLKVWPDGRRAEQAKRASTEKKQKNITPQRGLRRSWKRVWRRFGKSWKVSDLRIPNYISAAENPTDQENREHGKKELDFF